MEINIRNLYAAMRARNLSLKMLAERLGVEQDFLKEQLDGTHKPCNFVGHLTN